MDKIKQGDNDGVKNYSYNLLRNINEKIIKRRFKYTKF